MDYLRTKVSGNKRRFVEGHFNLDLSYITPRVVAMAIPGEGIRKMYRNSIDDVKNLLEAKHKNRYFLINISGKRYDYSLFENKVAEYDWIDHQAPKLHTLFLICKKMYEHLNENENNVVIVNCKAGKGRTGTIICCFMLFVGLFNSVEKAFDYYSAKRFKSGEGVSQPSQRRYVYFFYETLTTKVSYPLRILLESMYIKSVPFIEEEQFFKPYYEICINNTEEVSYTNKMPYSDQLKIYASKSDDVEIFQSNEGIEICGDFTINLYNNKALGDEPLGRISFNTAFLDHEDTIKSFKLSEIDPDNLITKKGWSKDFVISVSIYT